MKFPGSPIEKGMLPLLDITMLLFGIMIIVLTYAKFETYDKKETLNEINPVAVGISYAMEENTNSIKENKYKTESERLVENLVKKLNEGGKLIILQFSIDAIVKYDTGQILFDGEFRNDVLNTLKERIKKNNPIIIIGYPETSKFGISNKVTFSIINLFENQIREYTDLVFKMPIPIKQ